jgi:hypothetical protein
MVTNVHIEGNKTLLVRVHATDKEPTQSFFFACLLAYLALQPVFGLGLITKVTPFLSIPR